MDYQEGDLIRFTARVSDVTTSASKTLVFLEVNGKGYMQARDVTLDRGDPELLARDGRRVALSESDTVMYRAEMLTKSTGTWHPLFGGMSYGKDDLKRQITETMKYWKDIGRWDEFCKVYGSYRIVKVRTTITNTIEHDATSFEEFS